MNMNIFKKGKSITSEKILKQMRWEPLPVSEVCKLPIAPDANYDSKLAADLLDSYVQSKFRNICSRLGISYDEVNYIFKQQNSEFFAYLDSLRCSGIYKPGAYFGMSIWNVLVPVQEDIQIIVKEIEKLSPEQQDEIVRIIYQMRQRK